MQYLVENSEDASVLSNEIYELITISTSETLIVSNEQIVLDENDPIYADGYSISVSLPACQNRHTTRILSSVF